MYIDDWDSFMQQAEELYRNQPLQTRYLIKYTHSEGKLILKVTDDRVCLKYKTDQVADVRKMERLNNLFFNLMVRGSDYTEEVAASEQQQQQQRQQQEQQQQMPGQKGKKIRRRG